MDVIVQAQQKIKQSKRIAIFGHMSPDGDCIGSMLWLGKLLEKQKKKVKYFVPNTPSKLFDFVKGIKKLKTNFDYATYDLLIFVDFTGAERIGTIYENNPDYFAHQNILVFDHHIANTQETWTIIKDSKSISACEIIFEHTYQRWPNLYDKDIATYFYLWVTTDSWNFIFGEDHIRTFTTALQLLKLWADKESIVENVIRKKSVHSIKFLEVLLKRMKYHNKHILYTYYDEKELEVYGIDQEEASYGLHIIQNIDGPSLVLLIRKIGESVRCSLRAKKQKWQPIDCNKIAKTLWWWWHKLAAGFWLPVQGKFQTQIEDILTKIEKAI